MILNGAKNKQDEIIMVYWHLNSNFLQIELALYLAKDTDNS